MPTRLIVNADDFGCASAVNSAVVKARRAGILTSASLMVTGEAAAEAVSIARDDPGLAVGLHLALTRARSALPSHAIPSLVNGDSRFRGNPATAGLQYYFSRRARRELRLEIEAQFAAFAETGLPLSHVDGHQHMHAHPAVLPVVTELAAKYGASGIRVPGEPLWANVRADRSRLALKLLMALAQAYLGRVCRRPARENSLAWCDVSLGGLMTGAMTDSYVINVLKRLGRGSAEVYFHPADLPEGTGPLERWGPNRGDLRVLLSPRLKAFLATGGWELTSYAGLRQAREERADECP